MQPASKMAHTLVPQASEPSQQHDKAHLCQQPKPTTAHNARALPHVKVELQISPAGWTHPSSGSKPCTLNPKQ